MLLFSLFVVFDTHTWRQCEVSGAALLVTDFNDVSVCQKVPCA